MENLLFSGVPKFGKNYSLIIMCSNLGTPKTHRFPFGTNGKVVVLGVPILKHFRVGVTVPILMHTMVKQCCILYLY